MTSALDRFKNRKNVSMQFAVRWPLGDPAIEFTVKRIPQAIVNNALFEARGTLKRSGVEPPDFPDDAENPHPDWAAYRTEHYMAYAFHLVEQAKQHFVAWKSLKEDIELPPFSQAAFSELVSAMTIGEKQMLGMGYAIAESEDEKKKEPPTTSETGS